MEFGGTLALNVTACIGASVLPFRVLALSILVRCRWHTCLPHRVPYHRPPSPRIVSSHAYHNMTPRCTCGDVSPGSPAARSLSAGLTESEMPLSSSAAGSSLSESDPHVESHSSTVLGSLKRQLPNRFPI